MKQSRKPLNPSKLTSKSGRSVSVASSETTKTESGDHLRKDVGKVRLDLMPAEWVLGLGDILTFGANKYQDRGWEAGMDWNRVFGPLQRHAWKFWAGEQLDDESGLHHMLHAGWNALALYSYDLRNLGKDNRP